MLKLDSEANDEGGASLGGAIVLVSGEWEVRMRRTSGDDKVMARVVMLAWILRRL